MVRMMSVEENRQTALVFLKRFTEVYGPPDDMVTDDCTFWTPGFPTMDKATFTSMLAGVKALMPNMITFTVIDSTAERDRVAVEATGWAQLANGRRYENNYHFLF